VDYSQPLDLKPGCSPHSTCLQQKKHKSHWDQIRPEVGQASESRMTSPPKEQGPRASCSLALWSGWSHWGLGKRCSVNLIEKEREWGKKYKAHKPAPFPKPAEQHCKTCADLSAQKEAKARCLGRCCGQRQSRVGGLEVETQALVTGWGAGLTVTPPGVQLACGREWVVVRLEWKDVNLIYTFGGTFLPLSWYFLLLEGLEGSWRK
jgi:hypothetical protein